MSKRVKLIANLQEQKVEFILTKSVTTIGRGKNQQVDILIDDPTISRLHARILYKSDTYMLEDFSTFNRTYVNRERIDKPVVLNHDDIIKLGDIEINVICEEVESTTIEEQMFFTESGTPLGAMEYPIM